MMTNKRYQDLEVAEGVFVPDMGIQYPENDPYEAMTNPVYTKQISFDEHYPFVDDSALATWRHRWGYALILKTALRIMLRVKFGLRFRGRHYLRQYKQELSQGAITIANHMFRLDCPCVLLAVGARWTTKIPMFAPNFNTKDGFFMTIVGGVPIPPAEAGMSALKKFNEAFDEFHRRGYWFHIFPETKRWDFYKPLRPFQKGAFTMSYKYGKPILPCVITYRERTGIYRLFGPKELPLLQVEISEPLFPDKTQPRAQEVERLRQVAHERMTQLAGITHNTWPVKPDNDK